MSRRADNYRREREDDLRAAYKDGATALAQAAHGLQAAKEALLLLGNTRSAGLLEAGLTFVTDLRFSLREKFVSAYPEKEAARLFDLGEMQKFGGPVSNLPRRNYAKS